MWEGKGPYCRPFKNRAFTLETLAFTTHTGIFHASWAHTPLCKIIPACLNFGSLAPASLSNQPQPANSAIFGKIGGKKIYLAGTILHNGVRIRYWRRQRSRAPIIHPFLMQWCMMRSIYLVLLLQHASCAISRYISISFVWPHANILFVLPYPLHPPSWWMRLSMAKKVQSGRGVLSVPRFCR